MNSPPGSAVPNSHDVSERLVTDTNAASDAEVTRITAPEEQVNEPQLEATVRARTTSPGKLTNFLKFWETFPKFGKRV